MVKMENLKLLSGTEPVQQRRALVSLDGAHIRFSRRDHRAHAIQFSETGSRERSPSGPEKGSSSIFLLLLLFYYNFIVIQIHRSDPGKEIHARYLHLYYNTTYLPTHNTSYLTVRGTTERPRVCEQLPRHRHRYCDGNGRVYALYYNIIIYTIMCTSISRTAGR